MIVLKIIGMIALAIIASFIAYLFWFFIVALRGWE